MSGVIEAIHITAAKGGPMSVVESVEAETGHGLKGDRYHALASADPENFERRRCVTLIEAEALEAVARDYDIDIAALDTRRNLLTRGVALNHLVGVEFTVGDVHLRGAELCEPCTYLERKTAAPGLRQALIHRGGLRAEIVAGGTIRVGDAVRAG